ncbi:MAG: hypothetical protein KIH09_07355 [Candidatus Freyarchaeota archaeon]|nr:hypothetical protein [Candidatus Jordarchaeia archaeon]
MTPKAPPCPYAQNAGFELKKKPLEGNGLTGCPKWGREEDRDIIAVRNLLLKYKVQRDVPASSVPGANASPLNEGGRPKVTQG